MEKISFSKIAFFVLISYLTNLCLAVTGDSNQNMKKSIRILFIGNSHTYVNDMTKVLSKMSLSAKSPVELKTFQYTKGGFTLQQHWQDGNSLKAIHKGGWDYVVIQENGEIPDSNPKLMREYVTRFVEEIRKVNSEPVLFMTAAFQNKPESIEKISDAYTSIAEDLNVIVAPVGFAYKLSFQKQPGLSLHNLPDTIHANESGTYLTACVFYSIFTCQTPEGLSNGGLNKVKPENEKFLQQIAWDAVQNYPLRGRKTLNR